MYIVIVFILDYTDLKLCKYTNYILCFVIITLSTQYFKSTPIVNTDLFLLIIIK